MFRLFQFLADHQKKRTKFAKSSEYNFFINNRSILSHIGKFKILYEAETEFLVYRANIVIKGLQNKKMLEAEIANIDKHIQSGEYTGEEKFSDILASRMINQPFFSANDIKIYMPFFPKNINLLYLEEPEKLLTSPYNELIASFENSLIDPFDTYGSEIFNSDFSRLVKMDTNGNETAYFNYDNNTIYIINSQGRLDVKIVLFDKYIKKIDTQHMLERMRPVVKSYFDNNRTEFIKNLRKNGFISEKLYHKILKKSDEDKR